MLRREFLLAAATSAALKAGIQTGGHAHGRQLGHRERVDRAISGRETDRPPFTFWHHFNLKTPQEHADATLRFHSDYRTDIVKVMSDFPYPRPQGKWYELKPLANPFEPQIRALELIRDGLNERAYFIETIFNPWNVAEKLSSKEEVQRLKAENPQALLDALDVISQSEANHAKRAIAAGAAGIFLSVANANKALLSPADYEKFSAPFDRRILEAVSGAKLNFLHLHVEREYLALFRSFPGAVLNYSRHVSGIPIADVRSSFESPIAGGIDETKYRTLTAQQISSQWREAQLAAGGKFFLTPGCSVPNETTREELERLPNLLGA